MCHFVTMVLPPDADIESVQQVLGRYGRGFELLQNKHVGKLLKPREVYCLPTPKHCDCGTELGSAPALSAGLADISRDIAKKRRKGWSETKIARWLEQKQDHQQAKKERSKELGGPGADLEDWLGIIRDLRADAGLAYLGIMLHWYTGPLSERIDATRAEFDHDDDMASGLRHIEEDVLYIVR